MQAAGRNATSSMTPPRWVLAAHGDLDYPPYRTAADLLDPITQMAIRAGAPSGHGRFVTEHSVPLDCSPPAADDGRHNRLAAPIFSGSAAGVTQPRCRIPLPVTTAMQTHSPPRTTMSLGNTLPSATPVDIGAQRSLMSVPQLVIAETPPPRRSTLVGSFDITSGDRQAIRPAAWRMGFRCGCLTWAALAVQRALTPRFDLPDAALAVPVA